MRNQAISHRRQGRRRTVRSQASIGLRRRSGNSLRWLLRGVPGLIYLAVLILASWLLYYSLASPYFAVTDIAVSGNRLLDPQRARDDTGALGRNLLLLRSEEIEQSVRRLSVVKDARAALALPGQIRVDVTERTPLVQWQAGEGSFLVDREGVVFTREAPPSPVPVVKATGVPAVEVGSRIDPSILSSVEMLAAALPKQAGLRPLGFDYSSSTGIAVPTEGGPRVVLGDASDLDTKLATLAAVRAHLDSTKTRAESIDVRFRGRPVYVPVPAPPAKVGQARP